MSRPQISSLQFVLVSSLFLALTQNALFFKTVASLVTIKSFSDVVFLALIPAIIFLALNICLSVLLLPYVRKPLMAFFLIAGSVIVYYMYAYNILIDTDMIRNTFQTNSPESFELFSFTLMVFLFVMGIAPAVAVFFIKIKPERSLLRAIAWRAANITLSLLLILIALFFSYKDSASFFRNNKWTLKQILPSNYIAGVYNLYAENKDNSRVFIPIGLDAAKGTYAETASKPLLFVIVAGETARSENFSLGGYERITDPFMAAKDDLIFQTMTACNTSTATSLPCMFSDRPRKDYKSYDGRYRGNVLDIIQKTGADVLWVENNGGCKGICDRIPSITISAATNPGICSDGFCWDVAMIPELEAFAEKLDGKTNAVVVLHQLGSHGPTYYKRYPPEFRQFTPSCDTNIIKDCNRQALINTYDNTILYTDSFLNTVLDVLEKHSDRYSTVMLYVSDHGESLGEGGLYLHATPYMIAPAQQLQVPFMLWLPDNYTNDFKVDRACVEAAAARQPLSHDNLFHTIMGVMDITSAEYDPSLDLISGCRRK